MAPARWPPDRVHFLLPLQNFGVDVNTGGVVDTFEAFVWEPSLVKVNALQVGPVWMSG